MSDVTTKAQPETDEERRAALRATKPVWIEFQPGERVVIHFEDADAARQFSHQAVSFRRLNLGYGLELHGDTTTCTLPSLISQAGAMQRLVDELQPQLKRAAKVTIEVERNPQRIAVGVIVSLQPLFGYGFTTADFPVVKQNLSCRVRLIGTTLAVGISSTQLSVGHIGAVQELLKRLETYSGTELKVVDDDWRALLIEDFDGGLMLEGVRLKS